MQIRKLTIEKKLIYYGNRSIYLLPELLVKKGVKKTFICTDDTLKELDLFKSILAELYKNKIEYSVFSKITSNPKAREIHRGVLALRENTSDCVIAVGGGSVLDAAKLISLMSENAGNVIEYSTHWPDKKEFKKKGKYLIGIPTTAGSGSEMDGGATVIDEQGHKVNVGDPKLSFDLVIEDPTMTYSCPKRIMAACAFDAFCHSFESLMGDNKMIFSSLAKESVQLILKHLTEAYHRGNVVDKDCLAKASFLSGCVLGFEMTTHGLPIHSIGLPISEKYKISHGQSLAWVAPYILEFIIEKNISSVSQISRECGICLGNERDSAVELLRLIKKMLKDTNLVKPKDLAISSQDIGELAEMACRSKTTTENDILPFTEEMCKAVYQKIAKDGYELWDV